MKPKVGHSATGLRYGDERATGKLAAIITDELGRTWYIISPETDGLRPMAFRADELAVNKCQHDNGHQHDSEADQE